MSEDKQITISEFLMWLQGVEEMQEDDDWIPSLKQWKRIREKIDCIITTQPVQQPQVVYRDTQFAQPQHIVQPAAIEPRRDIPLQMAPSGLDYVQPTGGFVSSGLFGNPDNPNMTARTPNIDTSNGAQYQPAFQ